jgi:hypothetical protein
MSELKAIALHRAEGPAAVTEITKEFAIPPAESPWETEGSAMKLKFTMYVALVASFLMLQVPLFAHHGTGVAYEVDKLVTVKGTVTDWLWSNPHCGLLFDVTDDKGNVEHWGAELGNPHQMSGAGFARDSFKPGDKITATGHPAKSGAPRMTLDHVALANGKVLSGRGVKGNGERDDPSY